MTWSIVFGDYGPKLLIEVVPIFALQHKNQIIKQNATNLLGTRRQCGAKETLRLLDFSGKNFKTGHPKSDGERAFEPTS